MAITIGSAPFPTLTAQPFGYEESTTRQGRTARKWLISGLLKPSEWLALLTAYDTWRDLRILDEDTARSGVVGTTINFSGTGPGGQSWTNVPCWFSEAPSAEQRGAFLAVTVEVVDAAQALQVLLREQEEESAEDLPDFGTLTLGTTVLTLRKPLDTYAPGPQLNLTAIGNHYVSGPLVVERIRDVEGVTDEAGWNGVRTWYEQQIVAIPAVGTYFPITPPTASAEVKVISGVKSTEYTVVLQLGQVL